MGVRVPSPAPNKNSCQRDARHRGKHVPERLAGCAVRTSTFRDCRPIELPALALLLGVTAPTHRAFCTALREADIAHLGAGRIPCGRRAPERRDHCCAYIASVTNDSPNQDLERILDDYGQRRTEILQQPERSEEEAFADQFDQVVRDTVLPVLESLASRLRERGHEAEVWSEPRPHSGPAPDRRNRRACISSPRDRTPRRCPQGRAVRLSVSGAGLYPLLPT